MKTICNYAFKGLCLYILIMVVVMSTSIEIVTYKSDSNVSNANISKQLQSSFLTKVLEKDEESSNIKIKEEVKEEIKETIKKIEIEEKKVVADNSKNKDEKKDPEPAKQPVNTPPVEEKKPTSNYQYVQTIDTSGIPVISSTQGAISHYGHDCGGCSSGKVSSGYDISDGRIYYTDPTYGSLRIVAGGYEYSLGTVLRLTGYSNEPIIAIVLDRGGVGAGKRYLLDLLVESEAKSSQLGVKYGVKVEVLRNGF